MHNRRVANVPRLVRLAPVTVLGLALTAAVGTVTVGARVSVCDARACTST